MDNIDIRKIALFLSGKLPPYYNKANPGRFRRITKQKFADYIDDSQIDFIQKQSNQSEDFYFIILDDIYKDYNTGPGLSSLIELFSLLDVPIDLYNEISTDPSSILSLSTYIDEADFTQNLLVPFFKALGYSDVRYTHGTDEFGKDIIMKKINELGEYRYIGVQAKYGDIDAKATNKSSITGIITQAIKCFNNEYEDHETGHRVRISEYFLATNGKITRQAITEIMNIDPAYFKNNIHFLDKIKINNLLDKINK